MSEGIRRRQESRSPSGNTLPKGRFGPDLDAGWKSLTQSAGLRVENPVGCRPKWHQAAVNRNIAGLA